MKIAWACDICNWLQVSDSKEHHQMDFCRCDSSSKTKCGIDLEEYCCRMLGYPKIIAELKEGGKWKYKR